MGEKLTESITVKLSPTEMHQLKCLAAEEGLSWAEYMRGLLAGDVRRAQQRYQASLPPAVYQALVNNSDQRFAPAAMEQRALAALRMSLADPQPALQFFESPLGRRIIAAETRATARDQLAAHANGLPRVEADATRRLLIRHLAQALPATAAGATSGKITVTRRRSRPAPAICAASSSVRSSWR